MEIISVTNGHPYLIPIKKNWSILTSEYFKSMDGMSAVTAGIGVLDLIFGFII